MLLQPRRQMPSERHDKAHHRRRGAVVLVGILADFSVATERLDNLRQAVDPQSPRSLGLNRILIIRQLGRGAIARIYDAFQSRDGRVRWEPNPLPIMPL